jgi:hypothetical protein
VGLRDFDEPLMVKRILEDDVSLRDGVYFNRPEVAVVAWDARFQAIHIEWQGWADSTEIVALN